jgi:predicted ABC-type ATPase
LPVLTIVAGPNGAGKSTHSKELLSDFGIEAFDFDKEFHTIWAEFNFDPYIEQGAFERTQKLYTERRARALDKKQNFAFETNFHAQEVLTVVDMFRSKRYHIELIFICLENPSVAIDRVKDRVAKGGHFVDEGTIQKRFESGLTLLDENFDKFDLVSIYLSKQNDIEGVAILEPLRNKAISISHFPVSLTSQLPRLAQFVQMNR